MVSSIKEVGLKEKWNKERTRERQKANENKGKSRNDKEY
jgi:hypothetical protein